jgi:hypothetical protein
MLYKIIVFLHVISTFAFLLSHGAAVSMSFALKRERDLQKIKALLDLSNTSNPLMLWTLLSTIVFGVMAGFQLNWWRFGWIWTSLVLLVIIVFLMARLGAEVYGEARKVAGLPYKIKGKPFPPEPPKSDEELFAILEKSNPVLLTIIGYGGYAVIAWLMLVKPF